MNQPYFVANKQNQAYLMGERPDPVLKSQYQTILNIIIVFLGVTMFASVIGVSIAWRTYVTLSRAGDTTQGTYIEREQETDSENTTRYYLTYEFIHNDTPYGRRQDVNRDLYNEVAVGDPVEIIYFPADPTVSRIASENVPPALGTAVGAGILGIFFILTWLTLGYRDRMAHLKKIGQRVDGEIVHSKETVDSDNDRQLEITYAFQSPRTQKLIEATYRTMNENPRRKVPPPGTPVVIYYSDDHLYHLL